jgi:hypothetical protein
MDNRVTNCIFSPPNLLCIRDRQNQDPGHI